MRLVRELGSEHPLMWSAVESIAAMISSAPQTLDERVGREQIDKGEPDCVLVDERERLKTLERDFADPWGKCRCVAIVFQRKVIRHLRVGYPPRFRPLLRHGLFA